jgi:hypothetical protein
MTLSVRTHELRLEKGALQVSDWRQDMDEFLDKQNMRTTEQERELEEKRARIIPFLRDDVLSAFEDVRDYFNERDRTANVDSSLDDPATAFARLVVRHGDQLELDYTIRVEATSQRFVVTPESFDGHRRITERGLDDLLAMKDVKSQIITMATNAWKTVVFERRRGL